MSYDQRIRRLAELRQTDIAVIYEAMIRHEAVLRQIVRISTEPVVTRLACAALAQDRDHDARLWQGSRAAGPDVEGVPV